MIPGTKLNVTSTFGDYSEVSSFVFWHFYVFLFKDGYYNFPVFTKPSDENKAYSGTLSRLNSPLASLSH